MTVLAIDYGTAHIGLAIGDSEVMIASPYKTLSNDSRRKLLEEISIVIKEEGISQLVVGEPVAAHTATPGNEDSRSATKDFAQQLADVTQLPVALIDERFSTEQAKQLKKSGSSASDHELAAMLILQTFFDTNKK